MRSLGGFQQEGEGLGLCFRKVSLDSGLNSLAEPLEETSSLSLTKAGRRGGTGWAVSVGCRILRSVVERTAGLLAKRWTQATGNGQQEKKGKDEFEAPARADGLPMGQRIY